MSHIFSLVVFGYRYPFTVASVSTVYEYGPFPLVIFRWPVYCCICLSIFVSFFMYIPPSYSTRQRDSPCLPSLVQERTLPGRHNSRHYICRFITVVLFVFAVLPVTVLRYYSEFTHFYPYLNQAAYVQYLITNCVACLGIGLFRVMLGFQRPGSTPAILPLVFGAFSRRKQPPQILRNHPPPGRILCNQAQFKCLAGYFCLSVLRPVVSLSCFVTIYGDLPFAYPATLVHQARDKVALHRTASRPVWTPVGVHLCVLDSFSVQSSM